MLTSCKEKAIKDFEVIRKFDYYSDHRPISCKLEIKSRRYDQLKSKTRDEKSKISIENYELYARELNNLLKGTNYSNIISNQTTEFINNWIRIKILKATNMVNNSQVSAKPQETATQSGEVTLKKLIQKRNMIRKK